MECFACLLGYKPIPQKNTSIDSIEVPLYCLMPSQTHVSVIKHDKDKNEIIKLGSRLKEINKANWRWKGDFKIVE